MEYELSKLAIIDLENIYAYTVEAWSISQADKYYKLILKTIEQICRFPEIGKSIDFVKPNHRMQKVKSHLILYKQIENKIYIDRILHERMDIDSQLEK